MRRWLPTIAALVPLLGPVDFTLRAWVGSESPCQDHTCFCLRHCKDKPAEGDCHGAASSAVGIRPACSHDESLTNGTVTPGVLPDSPPAVVVQMIEPVPRAAPIGLPPGFTRLDVPPPRSH